MDDATVKGDDLEEDDVDDEDIDENLNFDQMNADEEEEEEEEQVDDDQQAMFGEEDDDEEADWEKAMLAHVDEEQILSQKLSQLSASDQDENKPQLKRKRVAQSNEGIDDLVPDYLLTCTKSFVRMIHQAFCTTKAMEMIDLEELRQVAIWMHRIQWIVIEKSLWRVYFQCGTGQLKNVDSSAIVHFQMWPSEVIEHGSEHEACLAYVNARLRQLEDKEQECRERLDTIKQQLSSYSSPVDQAMQAFVQRNIQAFRAECELKKTLVECDYEEKLLALEFGRLNPNDRQVIPDVYHERSRGIVFSPKHLVTAGRTSAERETQARRGDERSGIAQAASGTQSSTRFFQRFRDRSSTLVPDDSR